MIELRGIDVDNFEECILSLKLTKEQSEFIATNKYSLAEAYAMLVSGEKPMPYAIYNDDVLWLGLLWLLISQLMRMIQIMMRTFTM